MTFGALAMLALLASFYGARSTNGILGSKPTPPYRLVTVPGYSNLVVFLDRSLPKSQTEKVIPPLEWEQPLLHPTLPPTVVPHTSVK